MHYSMEIDKMEILFPMNRNMLETRAVARYMQKKASGGKAALPEPWIILRCG